MSYVDFTHISSVGLVHNDKKIVDCENIQQRKMFVLKHEGDPQHHEPDRVIFNYSSYELTDEEKKVLSYGLNTCLPPKKLNYADHLVPFELLYRKVKDLGIKEAYEDEFKSGLKNAAYSSYNKYDSNSERIFTKSESDVLYYLSKNNDIGIQKTDKGNAVVIINKCDYTNALYTIISDKDKFKKVPIQEGKELNVILSQEEAIKKFLQSITIDTKRKQQLRGGITDATYWKLFPKSTNHQKMEYLLLDLFCQQ